MPDFIQVPTGRSWQPIIDGITSLDLVAQQIVEEFLPPERLIPKQRHTVVIVGDSPAWFTLVNEIQWQLFSRYEVAQCQAVTRERSEVICDAAAVVLVGEHADDRAREWNAQQAPWRLPGETSSHGAAIKVVASATPLHELMQGGQHVVVFLDGTAEQQDRARRLARTHDSDIVMVRDAETVGLASPMAAGTPHLFGPSFARPVPGCRRREPVQDSMTRVAAQQHLAGYLERWLVGGGDPWLTRGKVKISAGTPWARLPEFYREDNVRQVWHLLQWFALNGWEWSAVRRDGAPHSTASTVYEALARSEYQRWVELRRRNGWRAPRGTEVRDDSRRLHPEMAGMESLAWNESLVRQIADRLWSIGLAPTPLEKFRRTGEARARQVSRRREWEAPESGLVFTAQPGDWCIGGEDDTEAERPRYVAHEVAQQLYRGRPLLDDPLWTHEVTRDADGIPPAMGRAAASREVVISPEGPVIAESGDWIITLRVRRRGRDGFDRWPVKGEWMDAGPQPEPPREAEDDVPRPASPEGSEAT